MRLGRTQRTTRLERCPDCGRMYDQATWQRYQMQGCGKAAEALALTVRKDEVEAIGGRAWHAARFEAAVVAVE
jgi:NMD protein affecting ribosome stability and mRNA decay